MSLIPVCVGGRIVEMCGPERASLLARARNVREVRAHKGGALVRLVIVPVELDEGERGGGHGSSRSLTYEEMVGGHNVVILKRYTGVGFVMWSNRDQFAKGRWNPDRVEEPAKRRGPVQVRVSRLDPTALAPLKSFESNQQLTGPSGRPGARG